MIREESTVLIISKDQTKVKKITVSPIRVLSYGLLSLALFLVVGKYSIDFLIDTTHNSKIESLKRSNEYLATRFDEMKEKVVSITNQLESIESRDDELRTILGVGEIDSDTRDVGIGGTNFNFELTSAADGVEGASFVEGQLDIISKLEREVKLELQSYQDLITTYYAKEDSMRYLPALNPIIEGRTTSSFGMRIHPVLKTSRKHPGIDLAAKVGTPIYAAADGVVKLARYNGGYGKVIYLDHKYGYETRYGHMSKILVREGQKVKRGDKIGLTGKTGLVTGPHLHYEVLFNGKDMDPRFYYFNDPSLNRDFVENRP